jgi:hypothetical protein
MKAWLVSCDACPYRERFQTQADDQPNKMPYDTCTTILVTSRE